MCSAGLIKYLIESSTNSVFCVLFTKNGKKVWWMAFIEFNLALIKIWKVYVIRSSIKRDDCVKKIKQLKSAI